MDAKRPREVSRDLGRRQFRHYGSEPGWGMDFMTAILPEVPRLRTGLWHFTTQEGMRAIRRDGQILPSGPERKTQWLGSLARAQGWVSLFDFERATEHGMVSQAHKWNVFLVSPPIAIGLHLNRATLDKKLIPNEVWPSYPGTLCFPFVEAWHPDPIPLSCLQGYLLVPWGVVLRQGRRKGVQVFHYSDARPDGELEVDEAIAFLESNHLVR